MTKSLSRNLTSKFNSLFVMCMLASRLYASGMHEAVDAHNHFVNCSSRGSQYMDAMQDASSTPHSGNGEHISDDERVNLRILDSKLHSNNRVVVNSPRPNSAECSVNIYPDYDRHEEVYDSGIMKLEEANAIHMQSSFDSDNHLTHEEPKKQKPGKSSHAERPAQALSSHLQGSKTADEQRNAMLLARALITKLDTLRDALNNIRMEYYTSETGYRNASNKYGGNAALTEALKAFPKSKEYWLLSTKYGANYDVKEATSKDEAIIASLFVEMHPVISETLSRLEKLGYLKGSLKPVCDEISESLNRISPRIYAIYVDMINTTTPSIKLSGEIINHIELKTLSEIKSLADYQALKDKYNMISSNQATREEDADLIKLLRNLCISSDKQSRSVKATRSCNAREISDYVSSFFQKLYPIIQEEQESAEFQPSALKLAQNLIIQCEAEYLLAKPDSIINLIRSSVEYNLLKKQCTNLKSANNDPTSALKAMYRKIVAISTDLDNAIQHTKALVNMPIMNVLYNTRNDLSIALKRLVNVLNDAAPIWMTSGKLWRFFNELEKQH